MRRIASALLLLLLSVSGVANAAKGTLILDVKRPDGAACTATVEIRKHGQSAVIKSVTTIGGRAEAALDAGKYDVKAIAVTTGHVGTKTVTIRSGKNERHSLAVVAPPASDGVKGEVRDKTGKRKSMKGKVLLMRKESEVSVSDGKFSLGDVKPGSYRIAVLDKNGKLLLLDDISIKAGENVTVRLP